MILSFGKYRGKEIKDCPSSYLAWLMNPIIKGEEFPLPFGVKEEATKLYEQKELEKNYILWRLNGLEGPKTEYIIERLGDLSGLTLHNSLEEALKQLELEYPLEIVTEDNAWSERPLGTSYRTTPDPEDDRILIWEILTTGHKKVVWHFSGWHWDAEEFYNLEQGKLIGDEKSLYSIACEDC
jgi:hypothetical protein